MENFRPERPESSEHKVWLERKDGQGRQDFDFYSTDLRTIQVALALIRREAFEPARILDPGAGEGRWGAWARISWPKSEITGVELRDVPAHPKYDAWVTGCFLETAQLSPPYDLVIGNPPYRFAEEFVRRGMDLLCDGGRLIFLLPGSFEEGRKRGNGLWREYNPRWRDACSRRPSFSGDGKTNATSFALYTWEKGWRGITKWGATSDWEIYLEKPPRGRPRIYATAAERKAAYRRRQARIAQEA